MSSILKKVQPRPPRKDCKCCIALELRNARKQARKGGHVL